MKQILLVGLLMLQNLLSGQSLKRLDGSTVQTSEVDKKVGMLMDSAGVQGLNLAVINDNKIVYVKSYGYRNKAKNQLSDTATIVYGASLSKAVFSYLVMKLVEEKIIKLDKPLYQYLKKPIPEYEYFADLKNDERWKLITARMCLSHTTGLPNVRWVSPYGDKMDTLGVIRIYFTPGSKYAYSGEGFKLLQLVVEEITGKNTDALATEKIFKPLGMTRTGYIWHSSFGDENVAVGHANNGGVEYKKKRTEPVAGGSMVTTISDYSKFVEHIMQKKGLSKKSYKTMLAPTIAIHSKTQFPPITSEITTENDAIHLAYGLGWGTFNCRHGKAFFKEGDGGTWRNYNINYPDKGIAVIILTNSENGEKTFQPLLEALLGETCIPWAWEGYVPYSVQNQGKDTTFISKEIRNGTVQSIFIDNNRNSPYYDRISSFESLAWEKDGYQHSLDTLTKRHLTLTKANPVVPWTNWVRLEQYKGEFYAYHPCDFLFHFRQSINDTTFIDWTGEEPVANKIVSQQKIDDKTYELKLSCIYELDRTIVIHIIDASRGIAIFEEKDGQRDTIYYIMIAADKIKSVPIIVNHCPVQKEMELEFDTVDFSALLKKK